MLQQATRFAPFILTVVFGGAGGCGAFLTLLSPNTVTVTLINQSPSFDVDTTIVHDSSELPKLLLLQNDFGTDRDNLVPAGQALSFTIDCDGAEVILLADADLELLGGLGPETDSDVLTMDNDFNCGDEIVFTFSHADVGIPTSLDVTIEIR